MDKSIDYIIGDFFLPTTFQVCMKPKYLTISLLPYENSLCSSKLVNCFTMYYNKSRNRWCY